MSLPEKENLGQMASFESVPSAVWERVASYCAYQERCESEVRAKLEEMELPDTQIDVVVRRLSEEGFFDERRFVEAFVRGRFSIKKWGRVRIRQELKLRGISDELIRFGMELIETEDYLQVLNSLAERKWQATHESNLFTKKAKVQRFLAFRGFENELIREIIDRLSQQPS
ncbi:MAG: RecX family transcriptional regulator [Lunatimonas sp.]|uniref:regulatory protein RecX n=1 Tax=Lunatimonas sp. TaxID=2060141 RepID=UPI00263A71F8|nr:regulatory protein RecX [Lunatimonas sp.]MCC5937366.1 RecX family transcriptional regulator [Lunatimonas sp.]